MHITISPFLLLRCKILALVFVVYLLNPVHAQNNDNESKAHKHRRLFHRQVICVYYPNPLSYLYDFPAYTSELDTMDSDMDGVVNRFDKEPNTPALSPVDIHGASLDSDRDGCIDAEDPEPYSDVFDSMVDCHNVYKEVPLTVESCAHLRVDNQLSDADDWILPFIFFDAHKADIRPDAEAALTMIAEIMIRYPMLSIRAYGFSAGGVEKDSSALLVERRIISSVNYLIELGVPEDRISVVKYRKPKQIFYDGDIVEGFPRIVEFWIESN